MKVKEIISESNPTFRRLQKLLRGQGVKREGLALFSGPKQVAEVVKDLPDRCAGVILPVGYQGLEEVAPLEITRYVLAPDLFRQVDAYGTDGPVLLIRVDPLPRWNPERWPPGCTLFLPFQDPSNVGAAIRSAAAFGVPRVVIMKESAHPFHYKSSRAAGSTVFRVPLCEGPSIRDLRQREVPILTLSTTGKDLGACRFPGRFGLLPGLEGPGIPSSLRHLTTLSIPMEGGVESLNAAVATGIALYLWRSRAGESRPD